MKKLLLSAIIACFSLSLFAISEADYDLQYDSLVTPYWNNTAEYGSFESFVDGTEIKYVKLIKPGATENILILNGRTESFIKYAEVAYDLSTALNVNVFMLDHRGQGFSERMLPDTEKGWVNSYFDYVDDVKTFVNTIIYPQSQGKIFLLGHSMGGGIATIYAIKYPTDIAGVILSAPMLHVDTGSYPESVAYAILNGMIAIGKGKDYAPGQSGYSTPEFASNTVTHSEVRHAMKVEQLNDYPEIRLGGSTARWIRESMNLGYYARLNAKKITAPVLMLQAGQAGTDTYVKAKGQDEVCARAQNCTKVAFPGAYHEILMESDSVRDIALENIVDFINAHK